MPRYLRRGRTGGAPSAVITTRNGKKMPLDLNSEEKRFVVDASKPEMVAHLRKTYVSHLATCPDADMHRRAAADAG